MKKTESSTIYPKGGSPKKKLPRRLIRLLLATPLAFGIVAESQPSKAEWNQPLKAAQESPDEQPPETEPLPPSVNVLMKILDGSLAVTATPDSSQTTAEQDVFSLDGEQFFQHFRDSLDPQELNKLFLVDGEGNLLYPAGLNVTLTLGYGIPKDQTEPVRNKITILIEHLPIQTATTPSLGSAESPVAVGGMVNASPVEGDLSQRIMRVEMPNEGTIRVLLRQLNSEGDGWEITGGFPQGISGEPIIWWTPFENGVHGSQEQRPKLLEEAFDAFSLIAELHSFNSSS